MRRSLIFADTSALFALIVDDDSLHSDALVADSRIRRERQQVWTIDPVLTELWRLLRGRFGGRAADASLFGLLDGGLRRESLTDADYTGAAEIARFWPGEDFPLTDRQAFAAIERIGDLRVWAYDRHFRTIRLGPTHNQPLELS